MDNKISYQRQLADPKWQRKRLKIFERDNFTCQRCNSKDKELHIHHNYYENGKMAWEYPDDCYVTLCHDCHDFEEMLKVATNKLQNIYSLRVELRRIAMVLNIINGLDSTIIPLISSISAEFDELIIEWKNDDGFSKFKTCKRAWNTIGYYRLNHLIHDGSYLDF